MDSVRGSRNFQKSPGGEGLPSDLYNYVDFLGFFTRNRLVARTARQAIQP